MSVLYIEKLFLIFTLSVFSNIYNINCGCCCNSCKGNTTSGNGGGIKKIIIKVTSDSITIDGEILNKLGKPNKPEDVVNSSYSDRTDIYDGNSIDVNNNYKIVIEDNNITNKPYTIAIVELQINKNTTKCYIVSCLNSETPYLFSQCANIKRIVILESKNVKNMNNMFNKCTSLKELNLNNFNTSNVTNMSYMFNGCSSLEKLNINNLNTNNVKNMTSMFNGCSALKELNLSNFKTNNVTDMSFMFYQCSSLANINLSNFITNNVADMSYMFCYCDALKKLDLSNFDTSSVIRNDDMFSGCKNLDKKNIKRDGKGDKNKLEEAIK